MVNCKPNIKSDRVTAIYRNSGHNYYTNIANNSFETMEMFKYFVRE